MVQMSSPEVTSLQDRNKTLIRSFIQEIFNEHNLSSIGRYFGGNSIEGSPLAGKGGVGSKQFINEFFRTFPDWRVTIEHIVAEKDLVVVFLKGSGTHKGEFQGIPPTNKPVNIRSAELYKIESEELLDISQAVSRKLLLSNYYAELVGPQVPYPLLLKGAQTRISQGNP